MPTTVTKSVGPGKDYSSLAAFIAGEQQNLVTGDKCLVAELYAMTEPGNGVLVQGFTCDETRYLTIRVTPGARHAGVFNPSGKYAIDTDARSAGGLSIFQPYTRVQGIQVRARNTSGQAGTGAGALWVDHAATGTAPTYVDGCIFWIDMTGFAGVTTARVVFPQAGQIYLSNCLVLGGYDAIKANYSYTVHAYNCTVLGAAHWGLAGWNGAGGYLDAKNCYAGASGTADWVSGAGTAANCAVSDATLPAGSGNMNSVPASAANFVDATISAPNLHLVAGSVLRGAAQDLGNTYASDIDGVVRTGTWDIGADQYVEPVAGSAAGSSSLGLKLKL